MKKRNPYIDVIKFASAIMIVLFHFGNNVFPGGRIGTEAFFMISGYLMVESICAKSEQPKGKIIEDTYEFIFHKWKKLAIYLIPSIFISLCARIAVGQKLLREAIKEFPLLFFEIFPMRALGFKGEYLVGISWYLSAMLISLAILYPLCRKFGERFIAFMGVPLCLLAYGYLCENVGSLAVPLWSENKQVAYGLIRGGAGCLAGCVLHTCVNMIKTKKYSLFFKNIAMVVELLLYGYIIFCCKYLYKSEYDYLLVFVIFLVLLIGISSISPLSKVISRINTRKYGTWSSLIVLNHYYWHELLEYKGYTSATSIMIYVVLILFSSVLVFLMSCLFRNVIGDIQEIRILFK